MFRDKFDKTMFWRFIYIHKRFCLGSVIGCTIQFANNCIENDHLWRFIIKCMVGNEPVHEISNNVVCATS